MNVELKTEASTPDPDNVPIMAARGDYMEDSLVGADVDDALEGTPQTGPEFIEQLLRRGHFGPFEHIQAYFAVEGVSRVVMAQVTRHRHFSWDVQSMRYVNFEEAGAAIPRAVESVGLGHVIDDHMQDSIDRYEYLYDELKAMYLEEGLGEDMAGKKAQQDARYVLPVGTKVNMTFSANARSLMHFFDLRNNTKAQPETQRFARKVLDECFEWAPRTFEAYEEHLNNNSLRAP